MKFAKDGKAVVCGEWTSKMRTHFLVSVAHCSDKDEFNKKRGKGLAELRMSEGHFIVLPSNYNIYREPYNLKNQLYIFLENNC